jgi:uncharacterized RDD family membrane protein YckC
LLSSVERVQVAAGFWHRLGASAYEAVLLAALIIGVGFALLPIVSPPAEAAAGGAPTRSFYAISSGARILSGVVILGVCSLYCGGLWSGGRRTLAMRTWRLALSTSTGSAVPVSQALLRFAACFAGPALALAAFVGLQPTGHGRWAAALLALNYAWACVDREGQFLQDRIAHTRLVLRP